MLQDEGSQKKLIHNYILTCGDPAGARGGARNTFPGFPVLQFMAQLRSEEQLLRDGVYEMMHEVAFHHFASKPKT